MSVEWINLAILTLFGLYLIFFVKEPTGGK